MRSSAGCGLALAVAACGTNNATTIPVTVPGQPALMTLKLGDGGWKRLAGEHDVNANSTTYQIEVADELELVGGCTRLDGSFLVSEVFATADDAIVTLGAWTVPDCVRQTNGFPPPPASPIVMFTATADLEASFTFDTEGHPLHAGMPRTFSTWQGPHDFIEVDSTGTTVRVQHDVEIDGGTNVAPDLSTNGEPLLTATYAYTPEANEGVTIATSLLTAHGAYYRWTQPGQSTAEFVPPDQLAPGDIQKFELDITATQAFTRGAYTTYFDRTVPEFDLLPQLQGVTAEPGELGATWTPFPDFYTDVLVTLYGGTSRLSVAKSKLWLERHASTTIDFDLDVDGYDPAWTIASPEIDLEARRWNQELTLYSGAYLPGS